MGEHNSGIAILPEVKYSTDNTSKKFNSNKNEENCVSVCASKNEITALEQSKKTGTCI